MTNEQENDFCGTSLTVGDAVSVLVPANAAPHAAHTPGPWHLDRVDVGPSRYITTSAGQDVARVNGALKERDANADLIAAAPDLLEAVKWHAEQVYAILSSDHGDIPSKIIAAQEHVTAWRAAVAKAEGR